MPDSGGQRGGGSWRWGPPAQVGWRSRGAPGIRGSIADSGAPVASDQQPAPNRVGSVGAAEAIKSAFALRNILKDKRFLYWDDYRPVQYAQGTVEVGTVLSLFNGLPFEVQMPQNVHDGTLGAASQATSGCLPWRPAGLLRPKL